MPGRVLLQDFTGVPAVVDLAAMRAAMARLGGDPQRINPQIPVDLVIDHSVQVDCLEPRPRRCAQNAELEFERNRERYALLALGPAGLRQLPRRAAGERHLPPGQPRVPGHRGGDAARRRGHAGLSRLAGRHRLAHHHDQRPGRARLGRGRHRGRGLHARPAHHHAAARGGRLQARGRAARGRHRHRPGAGGDRDAAQARRGGQVRRVLRAAASPACRCPTAPPSPTWRPSTAPPSASSRSTPRRCATCARPAGRPSWSTWSSATARSRACFAPTRRPTRSSPRRSSSTSAACDPSLAGPKRPQDRVELSALRESWRRSAGRARRGARLRRAGARPLERGVALELPGGATGELAHGDVVIAAITSCTNTSQPLGDARRRPARQEGGRGGAARLAQGQDQPGARLEGGDALPERRPGLQPYLEQLGFHLVGYGCTTCIGNSGPLPEPIARAVEEQALVVAAVLSGNRNFEGRINPHCQANFLASPPLVVAYALAGTRRHRPRHASRSATGRDGRPVFLRDLWPSREEVDALPRDRLRRRRPSARSTQGIETRNQPGTRMPVAGGALYDWNADSTYIQEPPFFARHEPRAGAGAAHRGRAGAGDGRRQRHHRPHQPGRLHRQGQPGRPLPARARRRRQGLQLLRQPARQRPGDDPRHLRQHPAEQPARARHRGRLDHAPALGRAAEPSTRPRGATSEAGVPTAGRGRQGLRHGLEPRLGGQGHAPARRARRARRSFERIHRSQPGRHGRAAAAVSERRERRDAGPERPRGLSHPGPRGAAGRPGARRWSSRRDRARGGASR